MFNVPDVFQAKDKLIESPPCIARPVERRRFCDVSHKLTYRFFWKLVLLPVVLMRKNIIQPRTSISACEGDTSHVKV